MGYLTSNGQRSQSLLCEYLWANGTNLLLSRDNNLRLIPLSCPFSALIQATQAVGVNRRLSHHVCPLNYHETLLSNAYLALFRGAASNLYLKVRIST